MRTRTSRIASLVLVVAAAGLAAVLGIVMAVGSHEHSEFHSEKWRTTDTSKSAARVGMAQDLIQREVLVGSSFAEVIDLLGSPDRVSRDPATSGLAEYYLGAYRTPVDSAWLSIHVSEGRVVNAWISVN